MIAFLRFSGICMCVALVASTDVINAATPAATGPPLPGRAPLSNYSRGVPRGPAPLSNYNNNARGAFNQSLSNSTAFSRFAGTLSQLPISDFTSSPFFPSNLWGGGGSDYGGGYGGGGGGGDIATTPIQGIDYGIARIIRAEADYNLLTSQAAINWTEAQRRELDNMKKWTETYFEVRRINREARAVERGKRPTEADFIRYAQIGKPRRLTPSELDTVTGQIAWPLALQALELATYRDEVGKIFAQRAASGTLGLDEYLKADQLTAVMMNVLRDYITNLPPVDYITGRRFLESLAYEARFPAT